MRLITEVYRKAELYGFRQRWDGSDRVHHQMEVFTSLQAVLDWVDPQREMIWETAGEGDLVQVSREFLPGTINARMMERRLLQRRAS